MKRTTGMLLVLTMLFALLLGGCVERENTKKPAATKAPAETLVPETAMPDPEDGVVKDDDGIITDDDTGNATQPPVTNDMDPGAGTVTEEKPGKTETPNP